MAKLLLAAGIIRDIEFDSQVSFDLYLSALDHRSMLYQVIDKFTRDDGSIVIRILAQYNNADLIRL